MELDGKVSAQRIHDRKLSTVILAICVLVNSVCGRQNIIFVVIFRMLFFLQTIRSFAIYVAIEHAFHSHYETNLNRLGTAVNMTRKEDESECLDC